MVERLARSASMLGPGNQIWLLGSLFTNDKKSAGDDEFILHGFEAHRQSCLKSETKGTCTGPNKMDLGPAKTLKKNKK